MYNFHYKQTEKRKKVIHCSL